MSSSITLTSTELKNLMTPLLPIARLGGDTMPLLSGVQLEVFGDELVCSVTDRFRLGLTRHKLAHPVEFSAVLDHVDIRRVLSILKPNRDTDPVICLTAEDDRVHVEHAGGLFDSLQMTFRQVPGDRPKLYPLLLGALAKTPGTASARINATYLAQFADAKRSHADAMDVTVTDDPNPMVVVRVGDHFIGVLMPLRKSTEDVVVDWQAILTAGKAAA